MEKYLENWTKVRQEHYGIGYIKDREINRYGARVIYRIAFGNQDAPLVRWHYDDEFSVISD